MYIYITVLSVDIERCLAVVYLRGQFQFLVSFSRYMFWSVNFASWVCKS